MKAELKSGRSHPIGVFDSGIGGLTVVRALMERLPNESIIYFGDTARVPYGVKSVATIEHFTAQITRFLLQQQVKMLIIACNTIAAVARHVVADIAGTMPVLDVIEAGAQAAAGQSVNHHIAVIATPTTINSNAYARQIHRLDNGLHVFSKACPLFVPLVEEGWLDHPVTRLTVSEYLKPVLAENIDTLVLGCTHYPLLKPVIREITGDHIRLIDSATTVAAMAAETLRTLNLASDGTSPNVTRYFVTDIPLRFQTIGERFLGRSLSEVTRIDW